MLIFGNNPNASKLYSERNEEQIEVRENLLSFGSVNIWRLNELLKLGGGKGNNFVEISIEKTLRCASQIK